MSLGGDRELGVHFFYIKVMLRSKVTVGLWKNKDIDCDDGVEGVEGPR